MRWNIVIWVVFTCFFMLSNAGTALEKSNNYAAVTANSKLIQTLNLLETHNDESRQTLNTILEDNLSGKPVKIMFYDLSQMNIAYENLDALTCKHKDGRLYILINKIHKDAPAEALACLLSHEVLHQDDQSSYQEEVCAWTTEAKVWMSMTQSNTVLKKISHPLVKRLNLIERMYVAANYSSSEISQEVHSNIGYKGLPEYSPGFGI